MSAHGFLFYAPDMDEHAATVDLDGDEHHHLARVLRARPGMVVEVTDGRGRVAECRVEEVSASRSRLAVTSSARVQAPPALTLALALIARDRFTRAVEQCIELGVTRIVPFAPTASRLSRLRGGTRARLERVAVSAIKQSGRAWLPVIDEAIAFEGLLEAVSASPRAVVGEQGAPPPERGGGPAVAVVGPEAGFTGPERAALADAGARFASVSRHRLRSETAAVALVAALALGD